MLLSKTFLGLFSSILIVNGQEIFYCNETVSCPEEYPCCSQYGQCGTGTTCLISCDVAYSYNLEACMPEPVCENLSTQFNNYSSKIINVNSYLGNSSTADWIYSGYVLDYPEEESLILAMPKYSSGTVLTSTKAIWYGKVSVRMKTSHLAGVVTAFILFSGVRDEIDFEFVGSALDIAETNYFWQGRLDYHNSANISTTNTFDEFHTYEIDWHEDYITWSVDGVVGRTLFKNDTWNETIQGYKYPQTPARVDISIWPGGNATNAPGTIAWAGGLINWDAPDLTDPGYYYAILQEVNITCYGPPQGTVQNGTESYMYMRDSGFFQNDVMITNRGTYLVDDDDTGLDPNSGSSVSSVESESASSETTSTDSESGTSTATSSSSESSTLISSPSSSFSSSSSSSQSIDNGSSVSKEHSETSRSAEGSTISATNDSSTHATRNGGVSLGLSSVPLLLLGALVDVLF